MVALQHQTIVVKVGMLYKFGGGSHLDPQAATSGQHHHVLHMGIARQQL